MFVFLFHSVCLCVYVYVAELDDTLDDDDDDDDVDAKPRCLPELHDVPYDTPPPSNAPSTSVAAATGSVVKRTSHNELMDEPIYANAAAHPPIIGK